MERSSGVGRSFTDSFGEKLFLFFVFLLFINLLVSLFFTKPSVFDLLRLKELERELEEKIKREYEKNERLKALVKLLKENPNELKEIFVRDYLYKIKKGERIVPLPPSLRR
ncbi:MAG: hypothetical protein GXO03_01845 [Aquificae bacterium]|nr:hypothetical protein [Aquificota bacterium]